MKKNNNYQLTTSSRVIYGLCLLFVVLSLSCDKDKSGGGGSFELENVPPVVEIDASGATETYKVHASGKWEVQRVHNERWVKVEPLQGDGDGTLTVTVVRNRTPDPRNLILSFLVDGYRQSNILKIDQKAGGEDDDDGETYIRLEGVETSLDIPEAGLEERYVLRATGDWKMELSDEDADWINIQPMEGTGDTPITLTVDKNADDPRAVELLFYLNEKLQTETLPINQAKATAILSEDFSWLSYGSAIFYETDGETRIDSWTAEEQARGWTSTVNTVEGSGNAPFVYAREGFVKLGKTGYGGDLISPKLEAVQGTQDVVVTFKAVPYQTAAGNRDGNLLKVRVVGPGEVSTEEFTIDNWPDFDADPNCTEIWKAPETERSFEITGATSETQIVFLGEAFDLRDAEPNKSRVFLDDILVNVK